MCKGVGEGEIIVLNSLNRKGQRYASVFAMSMFLRPRSDLQL